MPTMREGSIALDIAILARNPSKIDLYIKLLKKCMHCTIVEKPSIITVRAKSKILDIALGVGSIVCSECNLKDIIDKQYYLELHLPSWIDGKKVDKNKTCIASSKNELKILEDIGVKVVEYNNIIEETISSREDTVRKPSNYVALLTHEKSLAIEKRNEKICGRIIVNNPLHPLGSAIRRLGEICINGYAVIVEPYSRYSIPIATLDKIPLASKLMFRYREVFAIGFMLSKSNTLLQIGGYLGAIYECT